MQERDQLLGTLQWEYTPSQSEVNSLRRIAFYIVFLGLVFLGFLAWLLSDLKSFIERASWWDFLWVASLLGVMTVGSFVAAWIIALAAAREQQHRILFYEQGVKDIQGGKIRSTQYEELQVWQYSQRVLVYGISAGTTHTYVIEFPDGSRLRTNNQRVGNAIQEYVCQYQIPRVIAAYERGDDVDFGSIRVNCQGMTITKSWSWDWLWQGILTFNPSRNRLVLHRKEFPWSTLSHVEVVQGILHFRRPRDWVASASVQVASIPNVFVLLGLLRYLNYFRA